MQAEKAFPPGNVFVAYDLWLYKFHRNVNDKAILILFISTSNVVFTTLHLSHFFTDTCARLTLL